MTEAGLPLLENEQEPDSVDTEEEKNGNNYINNVLMPHEQKKIENCITIGEQKLMEGFNSLEAKLNEEIKEKNLAITELQNQMAQMQQQIDRIQQPNDQIQQPNDQMQRQIIPNWIIKWKYLLMPVILILSVIIIGLCVFSFYKVMDLTSEKNQLFNQLNEIIFDVKDLSIKVDILFSEVNQYSSVMLAGGLNAAITDTMIVYNSDIKNWQNCELKLPTSIASHGAVLLKNDIYILGGYVDTLQQSVSTVYKLGKNNQWTNVANMSIKRSGISQATVVYNSEIWVIGGWASNSTLKSVEKFNPETNTWQKMASMHGKRARAAATVINGKIYVSGGWDGIKPISSIEVFDPVKNYWEIFKELPHGGLYSHAALTDRTSLIIIGGEVADSSPTNEVWKINVSDPEAQWIKMNSLVQGRYYHGAVKLKDQIMVIGGMGSNKKKLNSVEMLDDINWTAGPKLPIERTVFATIPLTKKYEQVILTKYKCFS